ncbi:MAG TPA: hypothetical protein VND15_04610 [Candidatus Acidoferrales bacterium]|nr:hypothetical protein [Candidatus Acidoferrales bacterium]
MAGNDGAELTGFRVMVLPKSVKMEPKVKSMLRGYGAKYLRNRSNGDVSGRVDRLDADGVFSDTKKMMKEARGKILEITVQPLYSR